MAPERIVILRALYLGDLLLRVPAWRALRRRYPRAEITLVALRRLPAEAVLHACIAQLAAMAAGARPTGPRGRALGGEEALCAG